MKILLIIIDGLGDEPVKKLDNKTPLEVAKKPNCNFLAKKGICGQILPFLFSWQKSPESDVCHLALFGYDPKIYYLGRGPYEAAGIGLKLKEGDIAFRVNFGTVNEKLEVIDRRAGRFEKTQPLIKVLNGIKIKGVKFLMKKSVGHRAVLVIRGKNLSEAVSDGDPRKIGQKVKKILAKNNLKKSQLTAKVLNEFLTKSHRILNEHPLNKKRRTQELLPANYLLIRGAGKFKKTPSFYQKYRLKAVCIANRQGLYRGIAKILGMDLLGVRERNTFKFLEPKLKFSMVKKVIKKYDFIFCHIKNVDALGEDGNFLGKKKFIEEIDKSLKPLLNFKNTLIVITADHSTCSLMRGHCSKAIPILIYAKRIESDKVKEFSEKACKKGGLGKFPQIELMQKILKYSKIKN